MSKDTMPRLDPHKDWLKNEYNQYPGIQKPPKTSAQLAELCNIACGTTRANQISSQNVGRYLNELVNADSDQPRARRLDPAQKNAIRAVWQRNNYPSIGAKILLAHKLGLSKKQITSQIEQLNGKLTVPRGGVSLPRGSHNENNTQAARSMWSEYEKNPQVYADRLKRGEVDFDTGFWVGGYNAAAPQQQAPQYNNANRMMQTVGLNLPVHGAYNNVFMQNNQNNFPPIQYQAPQPVYYQAPQLQQYPAGQLFTPGLHMAQTFASSQPQPLNGFTYGPPQYQYQPSYDRNQYQDSILVDMPPCDGLQSNPQWRDALQPASIGCIGPPQATSRPPLCSPLLGTLFGGRDLNNSLLNTPASHLQTSSAQNISDGFPRNELANATPPHNFGMRQGQKASTAQTFAKMSDHDDSISNLGPMPEMRKRSRNAASLLDDEPLDSLPPKRSRRETRHREPSPDAYAAPLSRSSGRDAPHRRRRAPHSTTGEEMMGMMGMNQPIDESETSDIGSSIQQNGMAMPWDFNFNFSDYIPPNLLSANDLNFTVPSTQGQEPQNFGGYHNIAQVDRPAVLPISVSGREVRDERIGAPQTDIYREMGEAVQIGSNAEAPIMLDDSDDEDEAVFGTTQAPIIINSSSDEEVEAPKADSENQLEDPEAEFDNQAQLEEPETEADHQDQTEGQQAESDLDSEDSDENEDSELEFEDENQDSELEQNLFAVDSIADDDEESEQDPDIAGSIANEDEDEDQDAESEQDLPAADWFADEDEESEQTLDTDSIANEDEESEEDLDAVDSSAEEEDGDEDIFYHAPYSVSDFNPANARWENENDDPERALYAATEEEMDAHLQAIAEANARQVALQARSIPQQYQERGYTPAVHPEQWLGCGHYVPLSPRAQWEQQLLPPQGFPLDPENANYFFNNAFDLGFPLFPNEQWRMR